MKKSLYTPRDLTLEEHKRIEDFLRHFHDEGKIVFDLLRQAFGDHNEPVPRMAKAVNLISAIHQFCETKSCKDGRKFLCDYEDLGNDWRKLYRNIGLWTNEGWK